MTAQGGRIVGKGSQRAKGLAFMVSSELEKAKSCCVEEQHHVLVWTCVSMKGMRMDTHAIAAAAPKTSLCFEVGANLFLLYVMVCVYFGAAHFDFFPFFKFYFKHLFCFLCFLEKVLYWLFSVLWFYFEHI